MNLVETLIAGVVFGLASMGSLQIYGSSLRATHGHDQRQEQAAAMDLALAAVHQALTRQSEAQPAGVAGDSDACADAAVQTLRGAMAAGTQAEVSLEIARQGSLVKATAQSADLPQRQRWFSPAAYGLCGNPGSG